LDHLDELLEVVWRQFLFWMQVFFLEGSGRIPVLFTRQKKAADRQRLSMTDAAGQKSPARKSREKREGSADDQLSLASFRF
ncbi:hypothetical protein OVX45_27970, partial [Klebsiella pneumoniae]|uniref:hypothetical protein n=1 Tax=Klebsiella pneumoniae TaxID=573 RepID=UPI00226F23E7